MILLLLLTVFVCSKFIHDEHRIQTDYNKFMLVSSSENLLREEVVTDMDRLRHIQNMMRIQGTVVPTTQTTINTNSNMNAYGQQQTINSKSK
jgi:2-iminoacetate synthase ThiH